MAPHLLRVQISVYKWWLACFRCFIHHPSIFYDKKTDDYGFNFKTLKLTVVNLESFFDTTLFSNKTVKLIWIPGDFF